MMSKIVTAKQTEPHTRRNWQQPEVKPVGTIGDVLKGGNGKMTVITGDPGEPQKVPAMDK
ncbi:MAG: hypothetical protein ABI051_02665 [Vicinamibacterales bacterium]